MRFARCPRCNFKSYEILATHSHCVDCSYSPDLDRDLAVEVPDWAIKAVRGGIVNTRKSQKDDLASVLEKAA